MMVKGHGELYRPVIEFSIVYGTEQEANAN